MSSLLTRRPRDGICFESKFQMYLKVILFTMCFSLSYLSLRVQSFRTTTTSAASFHSSSSLVNKNLIKSGLRTFPFESRQYYYKNKFLSTWMESKSLNGYYLFLSSSPVQINTKQNMKETPLNINRKSKTHVPCHGSGNIHFDMCMSSLSGSSSSKKSLGAKMPNTRFTQRIGTSNPILAGRGNNYQYRPLGTSPSLQKLEGISISPFKSNFLIFSATTPDGDDFSERDGSSKTASSSSSPISPPSTSSSLSSSSSVSSSITNEKDSEGNIITREGAEGVFNSLFTNDHRPVILFDGICAFCNGGINLLSDLDTTKNLRFATLQSDLGKHLLVYCNRHADDISSIVVIEKNGMYHTRSDAMLTILENTYMFPPTDDTDSSSSSSSLSNSSNGNSGSSSFNSNSNSTNKNLGEIGIRNFIMSCLVPSVGRTIPRFLRDGAYEVVSENRYRFLGVKDECRLIDEEEDDRFLA